MNFSKCSFLSNHLIASETLHLEASKQSWNLAQSYHFWKTQESYKIYQIREREKKKRAKAIAQKQKIRTLILLRHNTNRSRDLVGITNKKGFILQYFWISQIKLTCSNDGLWFCPKQKHNSIHLLNRTKMFFFYYIALVI